ncbi:UDP-4-amino-4,6-dideoxy-N-acetyl-beta-L-altrosamine N-acetyltransferase [Deltaproteobacteria bacterium OttesenSCG-928-K17]|nr:UDP-4-amino-4,6-dideoxy-N-acetyl-beta-L-altrosamine N-acetyltransferase [Deltaproteobacteria bacterium OttesenSCG-928-K17]
MHLTFKNFILTSLDERKKILEWRNSERVRQYMIDQSVIAENDHLVWVKKLTERNDLAYYLVYDDQEPIGVIDFTAIDRQTKEAQWGFYLKQNSRPGFGVIGFCALEHYFESWRFHKLNSLVSSINAGSLNWHRRMLFKNAGREKNFNALVLTEEAWREGKDAMKDEFFIKYKPERVEWLN